MEKASPARPRPDGPAGPSESTTQPAIRLVDYMGDYDDLNTIKLIGPYPDSPTRDTDLARLTCLPLGAPEYHGGYKFLPFTMAAAGTPDTEVVAPERVAQVTTVKGFFAAYGGWSDDPENGDDEVHPDQGTLM